MTEDKCPVGDEPVTHAGAPGSNCEQRSQVQSEPALVQLSARTKLVVVSATILACAASWGIGQVQGQAAGAANAEQRVLELEAAAAKGHMEGFESAEKWWDQAYRDGWEARDRAKSRRMYLGYTDYEWTDWATQPLQADVRYLELRDAWEKWVEQHPEYAESK